MKGLTMNLKCYVDEYGVQRAKVSSPYELVGWYLEREIEGDVNSCKRLLGLIDKVKNGVEPEYRGTGNAHTIMITGDNVVIENEYSDLFDRCEVPLSAFERALTWWLQFISIGKKDALDSTFAVRWDSKRFDVKDDDATSDMRARRQERKLMLSKKKRAYKSLSGKET